MARLRKMGEAVDSRDTLRPTTSEDDVRAYLESSDDSFNMDDFPQELWDMKTWAIAATGEIAEQEEKRWWEEGEVAK